MNPAIPPPAIVRPAYISRLPMLACMLGAISVMDALPAIAAKQRQVFKALHLGERQRVNLHRSRGGGKRRK